MARKSNLMIGTVALAVIAVAFAGVIQMRKIASTQRRGPLRVVFEGGSASGLRPGGTVDFNGIPVGRITSVKLDSPRRVIALVTLDKSAPIRKDTTAGVEFQGLIGIAAISLIGGAPSAPPVPLDQDGIPVLTADLSVTESAVETLHNIDRMIVSNEADIRNGLRSFESATADLNNQLAEIGGSIYEAESSLANFGRAATKIEDLAPGLVDGKANELLERLKALHEFSDKMKTKSAGIMRSSRRSFLNIRSTANQMSRQLDPEGTTTVLRRPPQK